MPTRGHVVDDMLVLAAQAGDAVGFERLVARWHPRLMRHARRLTGDADAARDVAQDAWVGIVRDLPRLKNAACFGAWAFRITSRRAADWVARRQQARARDAADVEASAVASVDRSCDERVTRIREVFRHLDPRDRLLMTMYYVEGLSVAEAALAQGLPVGTVKSRLFHARERLRAALEVSDDTQGRR